MSAPGSPRSVCESPMASRSPSPQAVQGHVRSPEVSPRPERKSFSISDILSRSDPVRERLDDTQKLLDAAAAARYGLFSCLLFDFRLESLFTGRYWGKAVIIVSVIIVSVLCRPYKIGSPSSSGVGRPDLLAESMAWTGSIMHVQG